MRSITCVLVGLVIVWTPVQAQDWTVVQQLPPGIRLRIEVPSEVINGTFQEATDREIVLSARVVARSAVNRVEHVRSRKGRGALRGALVGFGVGFVHGWIISPEPRPEIQSGAWLGSNYAALGALIGMWVSKPTIEPVYSR